MQDLSAFGSEDALYSAPHNGRRGDHAPYLVCWTMCFTKDQDIVIEQSTTVMEQPDFQAKYVCNKPVMHLYPRHQRVYRNYVTTIQHSK